MTMPPNNDINTTDISAELNGYQDWSKTQVTTAQARILIIDDEPRLLQSLKELMSLHGFNITAAGGGIEAIEYATKQLFDLILLDLNMPEVSGHDVMDFLVTNGITTPVIIVSGETTFDAATRAIRQGAYDFLRKPYAPDELLKCVNNALGKQQLEKQNTLMQAQLASSEKLHRYVVNNSPDIIYMLDSNGHFSFLNDKIESLLGYNKNELIGKHYSEIVHPDHIMQAHYVFNERRSGERAARNVELILLCKNDDDEHLYFETQSIPIELNSIGIYSNSGENKQEKFIGTYGVARDITARKRAEDTISFQASHDLLTKLPNRALLKDRLSLAISQAKRESHQLSVILIDLDRFKIINDTLGHVVGDQLLQTMSNRINTCLTEGDTLARFGGNEFMILLPSVDNNVTHSEIISQNIINALREPFFIDDHEIRTSVSIGTALYPQHGETTEALIKNADIAMYHVKSQGKNGYTLFNHDMNTPHAHSLSLESSLRKAQDRDQFILHYQPQVNAMTGEIKGLEALIRWEHPTQGLLMPNKFVSLAEEIGLISSIGKWTLQKACEEMKQWQNSGLPATRVSVNLSAIQLAQDDIVDIIIDTLKANDLPGHLLEIEITENLIMKDIQSVIQKLHVLSSHDIKIAIDDFGTGYSSLNYIHQLPIHTLKIDGSFVRTIGTDSHKACIVDAIVAMAKGLRLNIIAECVETEEQLQYLRGLGCDEIQGYYYSKPLDTNATRQLLAKNACIVPAHQTASS